MASHPVLAFQDFERLFVVDKDAYGLAVAAVLPQKDDDDKAQLIEYASQTMNVSERKCSTCEREALPVSFCATQVSCLPPLDKTIVANHQAAP